jgi:sigma-B regulation protein RsbU (phosphoserine phosphatase)
MGYAELVVDGALAGQYFVTRLQGHDRRELVPDRSPFVVGDCEPSRGGVFGRLVSGEHRAVLDTDFGFGADDPFAHFLKDYRAMMAVPIYTSGQPEWVVMLATDPEDFSALPLEDSLLTSNLVGAVIDSMRAARKLEEANGLIQKEIERIARIQRSLLPAEDPSIPGLEVTFRVEAYDRAGGDLVDFDQVHEDLFGILVADASGHGISAAVVAAMLSAILHTYPTRATPRHTHDLGEIGDVLTFANRHLCDKRIEDSFVTAFLASWRPSTRTFEFSRAGHPPPMWWRQGRREVVEIKDAAGVPLGILSDQSYPTARVRLEPGDVVLMYSDGIGEAADPSGEQFGEARLAAALAPGGSPREVLARIDAAVEEFTRSARPGDDRTVVILRAT